MKNLFIFSGVLDPRKSCHIMHALLERQHLRSVTNDGLYVDSDVSKPKIVGFKVGDIALQNIFVQFLAFYKRLEIQWLNSEINDVYFYSRIKSLICKKNIGKLKNSWLSRLAFLFFSITLSLCPAVWPLTMHPTGSLSSIPLHQTAGKNTESFGIVPASVPPPLMKPAACGKTAQLVGNSVQ